MTYRKELCSQYYGYGFSLVILHDRGDLSRFSGIKVCSFMPRADCYTIELIGVTQPWLDFLFRFGLQHSYDIFVHQVHSSAKIY